MIRPPIRPSILGCTAALLGLLGLLLATGGLSAQDGRDGLFATPTPLPELIGPLLGSSGPDSASIILYDLGSGKQREMTFGPGNQWIGGFAPDGCRFAFVMSDPDGQNMRLYSARIDGTDMRELVDFTDDSGALAWDIWSPQWSPALPQAPDGISERIAFVLNREFERDGERTATTHIAWIPASGGTPTFYSVSGTESAPQWSPDGSWLAYNSAETGASGRLENDIWVVSADGATKYQVTDFAAGSTLFPQWSSNGEVISFIYAPSGNNHLFYTAPASGQTFQQWSETWTLVLSYDWLPDGSGLVAAIKGWQDYDDNLLWRVPLPGLAETDAALYLDHPEATAVDYPRFSADGRYLAFRSAYSAVLYDTMTGDVRVLDAIGLNNSPLAWSPVGFIGEAACP